MIDSVLKVVQGLVKVRNSSGTIIDPATEGTQNTQNTRIGDLTETAPGTDTASSGLNGRLQRIAQRITSLITALTDRTAKAQVTNGTIDAAVLNSSPTTSNNGLVTRNIPYKVRTYSVGSTGLVPVASATDVFTITGSGTTTVRIKEISISGTQTTASRRAILLIKRSTANSGGTSSTLTIAPLDSDSAAATAVVRTYTANPTLGTSVGTLRAEMGTFPVATPNNAQGATTLNKVTWTFGQDDSEVPTLRGTSQVLSLNLNAVSWTGGSLSVYVQWTEE